MNKVKNSDKGQSSLFDFGDDILSKEKKLELM